LSHPERQAFVELLRQTAFCPQSHRKPMIESAAFAKPPSFAATHGAIRFQL